MIANSHPGWPLSVEFECQLCAKDAGFDEEVQLLSKFRHSWPVSIGSWPRS